MPRDHRHELTLRILRTDGPATVESLSDRLTTGQATTRRDTGRSWGSWPRTTSGRSPPTGWTRRRPPRCARRAWRWSRRAT